MLAELQRGDLTGLLARKAETETLALEKQITRKEVFARIQGIFDKATQVLSIFPVVPPEKDLWGVSQPHRLSYPAMFENKGGPVGVRLRELVQGLGRNIRPNPKDPSYTEEARQTYGIRIELADDYLPPRGRMLFDLHPHMISTWDGRHLSYNEGNTPLSEIEEVELFIEEIGKRLPLPQRV